MEAVAAIIGGGNSGAQPGKPPGAGPQMQPIAPTAPGQPGAAAAGNGFGAKMLPRDSGPKPYQRTGFGAALDTTERLAKAAENPAVFLVERLAGDKEQAGTFANEHPEMMGIVKGLFQ